MLTDILKNTRSIRLFDFNIKIPPQILKESIKSSIFAPSIYNLQPLKYRIISDAITCNKIFDILSWGKRLKDWEGPKEHEQPPAYIVVLNDNNIIKDYNMVWLDVGSSTQIIRMVLTQKGYGSCLLGSFDQEKLNEILKISENLTPMIIIAVGKSIEKCIIENICICNSTAYYNDSKGIHHVPKRSLSEILI